MTINLQVFSLRSSQKLAESLARDLQSPLHFLQEDLFPDGEMKIQSRAAVEGNHGLIVHSLTKDQSFNPSENIFRLLMTTQLLKDLGAEKLSLVVPYLAYSRSDERREMGEPLALKYLAHLFEASGIETVITLDAHHISAFQNAFSCRAVNLECAHLFAEHFKNFRFLSDRFIVLSPDFGGIKRAERFRMEMERVLKRDVGFSYLEKFREKGELRGQALVGNVSGACVFIFDDLISTGKTILRASEACRKAGAKEIFVIATHGLFSSQPEVLLESELIDQIYVTDSNPDLLRPEFLHFSKLQILSCASVLSDGLEKLFHPAERSESFESFFQNQEFNGFI